MSRRTSTPIVTALRSSPRDPTLIRIELDGRLVGSVLRATVEALRLVEGRAPSAATLRRLERTLAISRARSAALKLLAARKRPTARLAALLRARGHEEAIIETTLRELARDGWVNRAGEHKSR